MNILSIMGKLNMDVAAYFRSNIIAGAVSWTIEHFTNLGDLKLMGLPYMVDLKQTAFKETH